MRKLSITVVFLSLTGLAACSKGDPCGELAGKVTSATKASDSAVKAWLDKELTGPNDEKLSGDDRGQACKMILDEKDALTGYIEKAKTDLAAAK